jgi:hypothetical protein
MKFTTLLIALTAVATTNALSHRFSDRVTQRNTNAYRFVEKRSTAAVSEGGTVPNEGGTVPNEGGTVPNEGPADERFTPKIEPGGDAPVMHTSDWIHAIVLGPDEVPPKLPTEEGSEEEEEDEGYDYGSGSGSGSGYGSGSGSGAGSDAPADEADVGALVKGLSAQMAAVSDRVDEASAKIDSLQA